MSEDPRALADYEVLELLLGYVYLRRDTKPLAKALLERFGSLRGVFAARPAELGQVDGLGEGFEKFWLLWREFWARLNEQPLRERAVVNNPSVVAEIARARLGHEETEEFWVALLDNKNRLVGWERLSRGTVDQAPVYPREVLALAISRKASGIIVVHNHPGGDPRPSASDIELTVKLRAAARELGVRLLDHLVVTDSDYCSFKSENLL